MTTTQQHTGSRASRVILLALLSVGLIHSSYSQSVLLDDFSSLTGWKAVPSDGAKMNILSVPGKTGNALEMDFDLSSSFGYTIARKEFRIDLPSNYQFTFDMKADAPVNNFEFKLVDSLENVWWIKKLNIDYPKDWTRQRVKKRQLTYAWGPSGDTPIRHVRAVEFVVSTGTGGRGKVWIGNFRFEQLPDSASPNAAASFRASSTRKGFRPALESHGTRFVNWASGSRSPAQWLSIDFGIRREIGGLVINWKGDLFASEYDILLSEDGKAWTTVYTVTHGNGGRDYIYLPDAEAKAVKLVFNKSHAGTGYAVSTLEVRDPGFSASPNAFYTEVAAGSPEGCFPKYLLNKQCFWTVIGTNGDRKEALINELGTIEVDQQRFSLEPFLYIGHKLVTWNDVAREQSLEDGYLPIPSVTWKYGGLRLTVRAFAEGVPGKSTLLASYTVENTGGMPPDGILFVAIRPFQVNPPWQSLFRTGGVAKTDSLRYDHGMVRVQDKLVIPMTAPDGFGATDFDGGDITEYLRTGSIPPASGVVDARGFASGSLMYRYDIPSGTSKSFHVAVPFDAWNGSPTPGMRDGADIYATMALQSMVRSWESKLDAVSITLPGAAQNVVNTIKSNLAYIFINRDGPMIQPGSRSYERSWIRDGALTSTALLQMGVREEVREFLDWYARAQFPNGKIPCVVDYRGADPTVENDSHGEYIYAIMQYFRFTRDTAWLKGKFESIIKAARYIESLRAERKSGVYAAGTPAQRACYGLLPESISHEGYSAKPMHSYWDDFFALRGLKDAAAVAGILGDRKLETEFGAERDDLAADLYASMRMTMQQHAIDYIPGCAELGDFDATSTTIGISPVNELGRIPEPQLHHTFDRYYDYFLKRRANSIPWKDYTPYENRIIGSFVYLGERERALEAMNYFMNDRHPAAWNEWAEVVYRDTLKPGYIGDMPHTWVGSDFIRSVRTMFVYEREQDNALVIGAGVPEGWIAGSGLSIKSLPTWYGLLNYSMRRNGETVVADISGTAVPPGPIILRNPLASPLTSVVVNGRESRTFTAEEVVLDKLPAVVELRYR